MDIGKRMQLRRKELKISADVVAEALGVSRSTIFRYEKGEIEKLPIQSLDEIAHVLQTTQAYLMGWGNDEVDGNVVKNKNITINLFGSVAAGALAIVDGVDNSNVEHIEISKQMLGQYANSRNLFAMKVNGESMNKIIRDGEIIVARPQTSYKDNDIVIFSHNNEYSLKRYKPNEIEGFVLFKSESHDARFKDIPIPKDTNGELKILGKVVYCGMIF